jgi:6-phosphofructokinase
MAESTAENLLEDPMGPPGPAKYKFNRVAIVFAGGPAPAANAVISTAATAFLRHNIEVVGVLHGYSHLVKYSESNRLVEGRDYVIISHRMLGRTRNSHGVLLGSARTNPGEKVSQPSHLDDLERVKPLRTVYDALRSIGVDALISIGGDDTLRTANKFRLFQERLPENMPRMPIVHLPKTIDNDYTGIDFTFGYFTAVDFLGNEVRNLIADAEASRSYFLVESMGRHAGWLAYGVAIAGEASIVISVEDIAGRFATTEKVTNPKTGKVYTRKVMVVDEVVKRIVLTMTTRESQGKEYGVIVLAEGLAELLPTEYLKGLAEVLPAEYLEPVAKLLPAHYLQPIKFDEFGHIRVADVSLYRKFAAWIGEEYKKQMGKDRKITPLQLGYEARCAKPQAFDVILGCQLGVGAYLALAEEGLNGVMVSCSGQFQLHYVPFDELIDPHTLITVVRYIDPNSDFHRLTRFLETYVNEEELAPRRAAR